MAKHRGNGGEASNVVQSTTQSGDEVQKMDSRRRSPRRRRGPRCKSVRPPVECGETQRDEVDEVEVCPACRNEE